MNEILILAKTYEELMRAGQFYEILGWVLGVLAFVVLIAGVVYSERRRKKQKREEEKSQNT